jgi:hypothetical protein
VEVVTCSGSGNVQSERRAYGRKDKEKEEKKEGGKNGSLGRMGA